MRASFVLRKVLMCLLVGCAVACQSTPPTSPTAAISGDWIGRIESPVDGPGTVVLQLTQTGQDIAGTLRLSQSGIADVSGTLTGRLSNASTPSTLDYTVTYQFGEDCHGTFSGTLTIAGGTMDGPFHGQNCVHEFTGLLHAARNP